MKRGKSYKEALKSIEDQRLYSPQEAIKLLKSLTAAKFDESIEIHFRLGVNPKHADQQVRGTVVLPHGTGKTPRVAVFAEGEKAKEAEDAGADVVGSVDLVEKVAKGWLEFDVTLATPDMMKNVGKLGKILGTKGMMPNPKTGTITFEIEKAVKDIKGGKIEYRTDKFGIIHCVIGKKSFDDKNLLENYSILFDEIVRAKPAAAKGKYLKSISMSCTMSPGVNIDTTKTQNLLAEAV